MDSNNGDKNSNATNNENASDEKRRPAVQQLKQEQLQQPPANTPQTPPQNPRPPPPPAPPLPSTPKSQHDELLAQNTKTKARPSISNLPWPPIFIPPFPMARPARVVVIPKVIQDEQNNNTLSDTKMSNVVNIKSTTQNTSHNTNINTATTTSHNNDNNNNNVEDNVVIMRRHHNNNDNNNGSNRNSNTSHRNSGNNNTTTSTHLYINPYSLDTNLEAYSIATTSLSTNPSARDTGNFVMLDNDSHMNSYDGNTSSMYGNGSDAVTRQIASTTSTLDTLNTYLFPCGADSAGTIGGATLNSGSESRDLDSNFSQMIAGGTSPSQSTRSTLSAGLGFLNKRRVQRFFGVGTDPYMRNRGGRETDILFVQNAWQEKKKLQQMEREAAVAAANAAFYEQQAKREQEMEKEKKKKRHCPPPQVRNQASRQMDDPMMNRPRRHASGDAASKKKKELELILQLALTGNEKYYYLTLSTPQALFFTLLQQSRTITKNNYNLALLL